MKCSNAAVAAANWHSKQVRKGTTIPYIVHPIEVMCIVATMTEDDDVRCAAVLHDVIEDCGVTEAQVAEMFGERVAVLVRGASDNRDSGKELSWAERKEFQIAKLKEPGNVPGKMIALGDKLSNMRAIFRDSETDPDLWKRFNASKEMIGWFYREVVSALEEELGSYPAWRELYGLVNRVFG